MADLDFLNDEDICYEGFEYVKGEVAEEKLGETLDCNFPLPSDPTGEEWDENNLGNLYPRLSEKYSFSEEIESTANPTKSWWKFW